MATRGAGRWLFLALLMFAAACAVSRKTRELLPPLRLPQPAAINQSLYLGIDPRQADFLLNEIPARVLVVKVLQSDCALCQHQAGELSELYRLLIREGLTGEVKVLGFGYGDDQLEVEVFAREFAVGYPLFADPRGEYIRVEEIPVLFIVGLAADGARVLHEFHGSHPGPEALLDLLRRELGK